MSRAEKVQDLPWREGFGGVMKSEFTDPTSRRWTILECDDGTYSAYYINNDGPSKTLEDLNPKHVVFLYNLVNQ